MCLRAEVIDDYGGGVGRVRRNHRLRNNNGGVGRGRGIYAERSEITTEAAVAKKWARVIYDNGGGFGGGRLAQRQKKRQQRRWQKINDASKG